MRLVDDRPRAHRALFQAAENGAGLPVTSTDVDELVTISDRVVVLLGGSSRY